MFSTLPSPSPHNDESGSEEDEEEDEVEEEEDQGQVWEGAKGASTGAKGAAAGAKGAVKGAKAKGGEAPFTSYARDVYVKPRPPRQGQPWHTLLPTSSKAI